MKLFSSTAHLVCFLFTLLYVGGFYVFKTSSNNRDDPIVIKSRLKAVAMASILSLGIIHLVLSSIESPLSVMEAVGIQPIGITEMMKCMKSLLLTMILFMGPLVIRYYEEELPFQDYFDFKSEFNGLLSLQGQRNYIWGPITEELVFRGCIITALHLSSYGRYHLIFMSPLYFGIAHLHHMWNHYSQMKGRKDAFKIAFLTTCFQFTYTTIFGWYASFLFIRTSSIYPPILCHSFCNMMGFPDISHMHHRTSIQKIGKYIY
ncbi:hypothetical protein BDB01DRAFT_878037 [Pilobolus umbonatus]|nr:hypothetical protein BDB01DRAFT_878037 [Pilobolus umbonatus]